MRKERKCERCKNNERKLAQDAIYWFLINYICQSDLRSFGFLAGKIKMNFRFYVQCSVFTRRLCTFVALVCWKFINFMLSGIFNYCTVSEWWEPTFHESKAHPDHTEQSLVCVIKCKMQHRFAMHTMSMQNNELLDPNPAEHFQDVFQCAQHLQYLIQFSVLLLKFQTKTRWSECIRGYDSTTIGATKEGRNRIRGNVSHMLENEICRWCWPHLQLL